MKTILIAVAALAIGAFIGTRRCAATIRSLRRQLREARTGNAQNRETLAGKSPASVFLSVTRFLFVTTQVFALGWVSVSYGIAIYSTIVLHQPFPVTELSQQAITTLLGVSALKVVENIFEHNNGKIFGRSAAAKEDDTEGAG